MYSYQSTLLDSSFSNLFINQSAFRYFGGKWQLSPWITSHFPPHTTYVEPFGGSFSVGLRKSPAQTEIYSDLHLQAVTFFQVLQQQPDRLIRAIAHTPHSILALTPHLSPSTFPPKQSRPHARPTMPEVWYPAAAGLRSVTRL